MKAHAFLTAVIAVLALTGMSQQPHSRAKGRVASVTDGDTFRLTTGERIRIAAIDAPETELGQAHCRLEIERGRAAKRVAAALLQGQWIEFERVGRSYRRTVAFVWLRGRNISAELVRAGAARPWPRHAPKPNWCTR